MELINLDDFLRKLYDEIERRQTPYIPFRSFVRHIRGSISATEIALVQAHINLEKWQDYIKLRYENIALTEYGRYYVENVLDAVIPDYFTPNELANLVRTYSGKLRPAEYTITHINKIKDFGGKKVYRIEVALSEGEGWKSITTGTIARIGKSEGAIIGKEGIGEYYYFLTPDTCDDIRMPTIMISDPAPLLCALASRIETLHSMPNLFAALIGKEDCNGAMISLPQSNNIEKFLSSLKVPWAQLLWGPPGCGKTYGIAQYIARHIVSRPNTSILLLAPSNRAADVALLEVVNTIKGYGAVELLKNREILRYGYPVMAEVLKMQGVLGSAKEEDIETVIQQLSRKINGYPEDADPVEKMMLIAELFMQRENLKKAVSHHALKCSLVVTTTTQAFLSSSPISDKKWDLVIIDEVTMVPIAQLYFIAALTDNILLMAGDPRQLGPVFVKTRYSTNEEECALGTDIFTYAFQHNNNSMVEKHVSNGPICRIMEQRRCHPRIWDVLKDGYPGVKVNYSYSAPSTIGSLYKNPLIVIDISNVTENCCETMGRSWANKTSAKIALDLAQCCLLKDGSLNVGVIAPYAAQAKVISDMLQQRKSLKGSPISVVDYERIAVGTVHRFQGGDADVIILDMVGSNGKPSLGPLLSNEQGKRLLNVAFSRARHKLVILIDQQWHKDRVGVNGSNSLLADVVNETYLYADNECLLELGFNCRNFHEFRALTQISQ